MKNIKINSFRIENTSENEMKVDKLLDSFGLSMNARIAAFREGTILYKGKVAKRNQKIAPKDEIEVLIPDEENDFEFWEKPLRILYEDGHLLVVCKDEGVPMMPRKGETNGALANQVANYFYWTGHKRKIRFVNRLDQDTSGIVLIAKHKYMQSRMQDDDLEKSYLALVTGTMEEKEGAFSEAIGRTDDTLVRAVNREGKESVTKYKVVSQHGDLTLLELQLETGRTHQIRVHLSHARHPIVGDTLYQGAIAERLFLHAYKYVFTNWSGRRVVVKCMPKWVPEAAAGKLPE